MYAWAEVRQIERVRGCVHGQKLDKERERERVGGCMHVQRERERGRGEGGGVVFMGRRHKKIVRETGAVCVGRS